MAKVLSDVQYASVFIYDERRYTTIPLSSIPSFKVKDFVPAEKKYTFMWQNRMVQGIVLALGATEQDITKQVQSQRSKRQTIPSKKMLPSATDDSSTEEERFAKRKKMQPKHQKGPHSTENIENYLKLGLDQLRQQTVSPPEPTKRSQPVIKKEKFVTKKQAASNTEKIAVNTQPSNTKTSPLMVKTAPPTAKLPPLSLQAQQFNGEASPAKTQLLSSQTYLFLGKKPSPTKTEPEPLVGETLPLAKTQSFAKQLLTPDTGMQPISTQTQQFVVKMPPPAVKNPSPMVHTQQQMTESLYNDECGGKNVQIILPTRELQAVVLPPPEEIQSSYNFQNIADYQKVNINEDVIMLPLDEEMQNYSESLLIDPLEVTIATEDIIHSISVENIEKSGVSDSLETPVMTSGFQDLLAKSPTPPEETLQNEELVSFKKGYNSINGKCKIQAKEISELKKKLKELSLSKSQAEVTIVEKDKELTNLRSEISRLRNLNYGHQDNVIHGMKEFRTVLQERNRQIQLSDSTLQPPVGRRSSDGKKMHMGRGVYICLEDFYKIASEASSHFSNFPKLLSLHLFGKNTLLKSTISGKASNRSKNVANVEKLNTQILLAVQDTYSYWLQDVNGFELDDADMEATNTMSYLSQYIGNMKSKEKSKESKPRKGGRLLGQNDMQETEVSNIIQQREHNSRVEEKDKEENNQEKGVRESAEENRDQEEQNTSMSFQIEESRDSGIQDM